MKTAIIVGSAMASFCVEKFGPQQRLKEITKTDIDIRLKEFVQLVNFDIDWRRTFRCTMLDVRCTLAPYN